MQVLQEGITQEIVIRGFADDRGDGIQSGLLNGTPAPFAHNQFVLCTLSLAAGPHHDRLQDSEFFHGEGELSQFILIEYLSRLFAVGVDVGDRYFRKLRARYGPELVRVGIVLEVGRCFT
ncbi:hypothetical protein GCM10025781_16780 [Kocuria gwangalliensis]|uniref:Uncharacterized protein n=1 Tax=Kocuria gwangalliensis TaxID=501592 RepID=A0ABP8X5X3_9MICC